jgi:hypothetical protein
MENNKIIHLFSLGNEIISVLTIPKENSLEIVCE